MSTTFVKLMTNIKHKVSVVETFQKYNSMDWMDSVKLSLLPQSRIIWESEDSKLEICSWPPVYGLSGFTDNHDHYVKVLYGSGSLFIVSPKLLEATKLRPFTAHKIPLGKEWIVSQNSQLMISLHLYDKTVLPALT